MASSDDILKDERERFEAAQDAEATMRSTALEDLKFTMGEQWPETVLSERQRDGRPALTINRIPAFIRQVVNDSRQNRPQIKVKPVDDNADRATADVLEGLVRNIEYTSKADVAYDTAIEYSARCGFGYMRLAIEYEYDDSFDKALRIKRVSNPFSVYGDPYSVEADSSDWNQAHVVEYMRREDFGRKYKDAAQIDWDATGYNGLAAPWREDDEILICEAWRRDVVKRKILLLSSGKVVGAREYEQVKELLDMMGMTVQAERDTDSYKITQRIMTGAEILEENEWAGQYIPVIPVYGEEINVEGKRHFRSLIADAKDAQRMFNYWRTAATELVALAPRVPFIGEEGAFDADPNWVHANSRSLPYLAFSRGHQPPQRQPLDSGVAAGAMQEAMMASDDMKSIMGLYDASLGAKSNETSGKAIMARQREGDVSTFHFIDNLSRGIRHLGCCLIDLIPKVYTPGRMIRILGDDGKEQVVKIGQTSEAQGVEEGQNEQLQGVAQVYDLGTGRYDVAIDTGPSFTTRREEAATAMTEMVRSFPAAAPIIGPHLVKALNFPGAEKIAEELEALKPQPNGGLPPEVQQMIEEGKQMIGQLQQENQQIKTDKSLEAEKVRTDGYKAETDRLKEMLPYMTPESLARLGLQMQQQAVTTADPAP